LQAKIGIGIKTPESQIDIKGDVKIGNEGKTDAKGKKWMIRWSDAKVCFERRDGAQMNVKENTKTDIYDRSKQ